MKKSSIFLLTILLSSTILFAVPAISSASYEVVELWSYPMAVVDVAVSTDGQYIAAVNYTTIAFFSRGSSTPIWWYCNNSDIEEFLSVAISADGNQVIVGNNSVVDGPPGSIYYFDNCLSRSGLQAPNSYDWTSAHFTGFGSPSVERRTIDISANGEFVVVGGTGTTLYYFSGCTSRSGAGLNWDWARDTGDDIRALDMTPDGRYVAMAGPSGGPGGFVSFIGNADLPGTHLENWTSFIDSSILDIAISNDGYAVAAVGGPLGTLYYWADAKSLSGTPQPNTWNNTNPLFNSVDVDSSGDRVVAGTLFEIFDGTLHFWDGARTLTGNNVTETWTQLHGFDIFDVGIDDSGGLIVATSAPSGIIRPAGAFQTNFFTADGSLIANFTIDTEGDVVSVAGYGNTAAVGTPRGLAGYSTLYVYGITAEVAVGGELLIIDKIALLAPYLMVAAVIVAAGALLRRRVP